MKKKARKRHLLNQQKPRRRLRLSSLKKPSILVFILTFSVYLYSSIDFSKIKLGEPSVFAQDSKIEVLSDQLSREKIRELEDIAIKHSGKAFTQIVEKMQQHLAVKRVSVIRTGTRKISILVDDFQPEIIIKLKELHFVNADGLVYGRAPAGESNLFPILKGLESESTPKMSPDFSYNVGKSKQLIILDALVLVRSSLRYNIKYRSIVFDRYRGFKAKLRDRNIEVELGFHDFESKLNRLKKILPKISTDESKALQIDLDYASKAFIQES